MLPFFEIFLPKIKGIRFNYFIAFVTANNINLNSFL